MEMDRKIVLMVLLLGLTSFSGCLGGSENDATTDSPDATTTLDEWHVYSVTDYNELPQCNQNTQGRLYYLSSTAAFLVCNSTGWSEIDVSGADGVDGADGSDGLQGLPGDDGEDGLNGQDGRPGIDGLNSRIRLVYEEAGENCIYGGTVVLVGIDINRDSELDDGEIEFRDYICNPVNPIRQIEYKSSPPPHCDAGGYVEYSGLDDGVGGGIAGNQVLESEEIDLQTTFCSEYVTGPLFNTDGESGDLLGASSTHVFLQTGDTNSSVVSFDLTNKTKQKIAEGDACPDNHYQCGVFIGNHFYFSTYSSGANPSKFYVSDGTVSGTQLIGNLQDRLTGMLTDGTDVFLFLGDSGIWKFDGVTVSFLSNAVSGDYDQNDNYPFLVVNSSIFFVALGDTQGEEVWVSDGTSSGTRSTGCRVDTTWAEYNKIYKNSNLFYLTCRGESGSYDIHTYNMATSSLSKVSNTARFEVIGNCAEGVLAVNNGNIYVLDSIGQSTRYHDTGGFLHSRNAFNFENDFYYLANLQNGFHLMKLNTTSGLVTQVSEFRLPDNHGGLQLQGSKIYSSYSYSGVRGGYAIFDLNTSEWEFGDGGDFFRYYFDDFYVTDDSVFFTSNVGRGPNLYTVYWNKNIETTVSIE